MKVSLDVLQKTESTLKKAQEDLGEAKQKIEALTRPRITRKNNVIIRNVVAEKSDLFHDTTYKVEKHTIKQPEKGDPNYDDHYIQKLSRIAKGNVESILSALKRKKCDLDVLNSTINQWSEISQKADALINPEDKAKYTEIVRKAWRRRAGGWMTESHRDGESGVSRMTVTMSF